MNYDYDKIRYIFKINEKVAPFYQLDGDCIRVILKYFVQLGTNMNPLGHVTMSILQSITSMPDNNICKPNILFPTIKLSVEPHSNFNAYYHIHPHNYLKSISCFEVLCDNVEKAQLNCEIVEIKVDYETCTEYTKIVSDLQMLIEWLQINNNFYSKSYAKIYKLIVKKRDRIEKHIKKFRPSVQIMYD